MKLAVWKTGHPIADTVADAFSSYGDIDFIDNADKIITGNARNISYPASEVPRVIAELYNQYGTNICYGILRGASNVFAANSWFNVDRGYFNPNHFDGYYRISYKGTQAKWHHGIPQKDIEFRLEDWRSGELGSILIVPPTQHVIDFFGLPHQNDWIAQESNKIFNAGYRGNMWVKHKDDNRKIDWNYVKGVITFNSSIGWQALQRGIPVISDPEHSIIGSFYKHHLKNNIDFLSDEYKAVDRLPLFKAMQGHQFTLKEISEGKAWPILNHYLST